MQEFVLRKCYCWLNISTFTDSRLSVCLSIGWKKWVDETQRRLYRPFFSLGHCYSLFFSSSVDITANVVTVEGVLYFCILFFFWCELAPSPGLLWFDSSTAAPWIFPLNADLRFSQAKGGAAPPVCMILMILMQRVVMMIFMLGVLNEWMWHWLAETSNIFNLN